MASNGNERPNKFLQDRTIERGTGCWNCKHRDSWEQGKLFWLQKRESSLSKAVGIAVNAPQGENDPRVVNIRRFVSNADRAFQVHEAIHCTTGITAQGQQVGDITPANYMCHKWTGMDGASLAKIDGRVDELPEDLLAEEQPMTLKQFAQGVGQPSLLKKTVIE